MKVISVVPFVFQVLLREIPVRHEQKIAGTESKAKKRPNK
jgi:hypothetical protein